MRHLTVRNVPDHIAQALRTEKETQSKSLNQTVIDALERGLGFDRKGKRSNGLARFSGGWTAKELSEFNEAIRPFEDIDEDLWQ